MRVLTQRRRGTEKGNRWLLCAPEPLCKICLLVVLATGPIIAVADEREELLARSPRVVAEQLAKVYGQKLDQVAYIPALPLVAKVRLSELSGDASHRAEVEKIVAPYLAGDKSPVPKAGNEQAGHLIFAELARQPLTPNPSPPRGEGNVDRQRWIELCRNAADQIFDENG